MTVSRALTMALLVLAATLATAAPVSAEPVSAVGAAAGALTSQASGYTFKVKADYCTGADSDKAYFKARITADGSTPADELSIGSRAQVYYSGGWHTTYVWNEQTYSFDANGTTHYLTGWREYRYAGYSVRIKMRLRAWKGSTILAEKTFYSGVCP